METKRDSVKDIIRAAFEEWSTMDGHKAYELACDLADKIFDALGLSPKEQDEPANGEPPDRRKKGGMMKHTNGPWKIDRHGEIVNGHGRRIATLQAHGDHGMLLSEDVSNGNLLSTAPEMLKALKHVKEVCMLGFPSRQMVEQAIVKAESGAT